MTRRKEHPTNFTPEELSTASAIRNRYDTELEQLMVLAPGQNQLMNTVEATADLKEAVGEAIDSLPIEDRDIYELLFIAHMSLRATEKIVGIPKTSLARRRDKIRRRLMLDLSQDRRVQKWMYRDF
jgi:uncharacterized protein (DUF2384 family)